MIELFTELPDEVKRQHEQTVDLIFKTLKPFQLTTFLNNYINTCAMEEEKDFVNFLINLRLEKDKDANNND